MKKALIIIAVIGAIVVLKVSDTGYSDEEIEHNRYCDMVADFKASEGQRGWPPYKGECND